MPKPAADNSFSRTAPVDSNPISLEQRRKVWDLALTGLNARAISKTVSMDERRVGEILRAECDRVREEINESVDMVRVRQGAILDETIALCRRKAFKDINAPDLDAIDRMLRAMNEKAKLFGAYAPIEVNVAELRAQRESDVLRFIELISRHVPVEKLRDLRDELAELIGRHVDVVDSTATALPPSADEDGSDGQ